MLKVSCRSCHIFQPASMLLTLIVDAVCYLGLCLRPSPTLTAENLFLRKQLALYQERHVMMTAHPTAEWPLQQLREAIPADHAYHFLIHDRDSIFSHALDQSIGHLSLKALRTPVRTPIANAICERLIGTLRRECLDFVLPLTEHHLRRRVMAWIHFYNENCPHISLGPGIPQPSASLPVPRQPYRHRIPASLRVISRPILGGLYHDYRLEPQAA